MNNICVLSYLSESGRVIQLTGSFDNLYIVSWRHDNVSIRDRLTDKVYYSKGWI